ncbi:MAG: hypothetical protein KME01_09045 [Chroococcus sp. CMT-3BRIN-NPC107]|jgi:hypothetical protein|nr:hypothetical protein [Chroococcus sp. CMT-3BRIN-NPC107]
MTQESNNPINLSVHETADPKDISLHPREASAGANSSVHDDENVDVPKPELLDNNNEEDLRDNQITIANLGAG